MQRTKTIIIIYFISGLLGGLAGYGLTKYQEKQFKDKVDKMNAHIKQLHEDGYSWEAARKIGATEAGFIPLDEEYKALKED